MSASTVDATTLAIALEAAVTSLAELRHPGRDAFNELIRTCSGCPDFDAGVDPRDKWIGDDPKARFEAKRREIARRRRRPASETAD